MPELPWRRRRRASDQVLLGETQSEGTSLRTQEAAPPTFEYAAYLERAARCYLRAGNLAVAAGCLSKLGKYDQAAQAYLDSGDYRQARDMYLRTRGLADIGAWIAVHYLDDPVSARKTAQQISHRTAPAPRSAKDPDSAQQSYLADRLRRICAHLERQQAGEFADAGEPPGTASHSVLGQIVDKALEVDWANADPGAPAKLIKAVKTAAIVRDDWLTGYAACEIQKLLESEQSVRLGERELDWQRGKFQATRILCCDLVIARCDAAIGAPHQRIAPVLARAQAYLGDSGQPWLPRIETWSVAVAAKLRRHDHVALTFAAAVRGQRPGAAGRWRQWSAEVLHTDAAMLADAEMS